jgi:hypothetical protein
VSRYSTRQYLANARRERTRCLKHARESIEPKARAFWVRNARIAQRDILDLLRKRRES